MKQLLLLRHAKSSWSDSSLADFDRPLNDRGFADAPRIGKFIRETEYLPGHIYCSTAKRAGQTLTRVVDSWSEVPEIKRHDDFYSKSYTHYVETVKNAPEAINRIMMVGHNPKIEQTVDALIGGDSSGLLRVPTAGLICIQFKVTEWKQIIPGLGQLKWMMIPKVLKKMSGY